MNLVANAAEAMPDGGEVVISTRTVAADVPIRGAMTIPPGVYTVLSVADDGLGIPGSMVQRIFEPFFTTKVMGRSGTGLGMAVVWATVQDHDGHIDIRTEEGRGTTMTLYFPAVDAPEEQPSALEQEEEAAKGRGERILVVDDVAEQRDLGEMILSRLDYRVESAAGGEAAIERLRQGRVDLLVLDMVMDPGIDGLETFRRAREIDPAIKAVIVSGFAESDRVRKAQSLGAGAYLKKPYLIREIAEVIRAELDRSPSESVSRSR
jgi:CheY-like chemotaxis protein